MWKAIKDIKDKPLWAMLVLLAVMVLCLHHHPEIDVQGELDGIKADLAEIKTAVGVTP